MIPDSVRAEVSAIWPDNQWTIEDMLAEGDKVCVRLTNRATHQGMCRGIPATGRIVELYQSVTDWHERHPADYKDSTAGSSVSIAPHTKRG